MRKCLAILADAVEQAISYFTVIGVSKQLLLFSLTIDYLRSAKCFFHGLCDTFLNTIVIGSWIKFRFSCCCFIIRCPKIEHARAILEDEIDKESAGHPQLIIIHTGTNDLTTTTPIDDFISDISVLITQASTKFPKSKIVYSTLLPRTDIPLHTLSKINTNLIDSCSKLPNVHLVNHDNIFSKGTEVLHDRKHLKKRHLGLFAANLKAAIRGRGKPPRANSSQLYRSSLSSSHSFHTSPSEGYLPFSNGVRNIHRQVHQTSRQAATTLTSPFTIYKFLGPCLLSWSIKADTRNFIKKLWAKLDVIFFKQ